MGKLKTRKTAAKRFKKTNPRGNKCAKVLYNKSRQGHLRTKKTSRRKGRSLSNTTLSPVGEKVISRMHI